MSSSPKFLGPPLAAERVILRGAAASQLRAAVMTHDDIAPEITAAAVREAARAEGYAAGWAEGSRASRATLMAQAEHAATRRHQEDLAQAENVRSALLALTRAADELDRRIQPLAQEMEQALVGAAFAMAEAILGRELAVGTDPGHDAIRRALAVAPHGQPVRVRLHPLDAAAVDSIELSRETGRDIQLVADPTVDRGDAIAHCGATRIDAGLPAAVQRVRQALQP